MGLIKYNTDTGFRRFNVADAIKEHWGLDYIQKDDLIGLELQDRQDPSYSTKITEVFWNIGILSIGFEEGGWLALDHAIEQFKVK